MSEQPAVSRRAGRKKDAPAGGGGGRSGGAPIKKALYETNKKKEVGVSDLTLISKISNEAINENLQKRFQNAEIYVRFCHISSDSIRLPARQR